MRQIGTLSNLQQSQRFVDYLLTLGIASRADEEADDTWAIWIIDEEHLAKAALELRDFQFNPEDPRFRQAASKAESIRQAEQQRRTAAAKNIHHMRGQWNRGMTRKAPLTFLLIAACAAVFMLQHMGTPEMRIMAYNWLAFRAPLVSPDLAANPSEFRDIQRGQIWRLVTPILLHGDAMHIFFNLYMLYYFGGQFEHRRGWLYMLLFVMLSAAFSNAVQVSLTNIGVIGISGVVYALIGYVWMQSRFLPKSGFFVGQFTIFIAIAWLFVGFLPFTQFQGIAHAAHGAGLFFGVVVGYLPVMFPNLEGKV